MMIRAGSNFLRAIGTNAWPKEPVPPVTRMVDFDNGIDAPS
jgi:hypothetical protein